MMKVKPDSPNPVAWDAGSEPSLVDPLDAVSELDGRSSANTNQGLKPAEIGGVAGPDPTRYGDWEHKGRCFDF